MRKQILLLGVLLVLNFGYSQADYSYYLDGTSEWRYHRSDFNIYTGEGNNYYTTFYFDGNEVYNNITYYKRYVSELKVTQFMGSSTSTSQVTLYGPTLVREESDGKFYVVNPETNIEYCYFDSQVIINAQIGDLFPMDINCTVQSISNYQIGLLSLKKINGNNTGSLAGSLEGVGNIGPICGLSYEGGDTRLNCYKKQEIEIQFGTIDCSMFPTPYRTSLGSVGNNLNNVYFKISPNPAKEVLNITTNLSVIILSVKIYNTIGQLVLVNHTNNNLIDVTNLKAGTYFINIVSDKGTSNSKFIKQ